MRLQPPCRRASLNGMKHRPLFVGLLFAALVACAPPAFSQAGRLQFDAAKVPVGRVFHYSKSNRDGSHAASISVYVSAIDRVEALKWDEGGDEATLVLAEMDWSRFSVRRFEAWYLKRAATPERRAILEATGEQLSTSITPSPITLRHWPWHSYDFDFTSLSLTLPHLIDATSGLSFWRTDYVYGDTPRVAEIGEVVMRFEGNERRNGRAVRRYSIGGPGLEGKQGTWWSDARSGLLVAFELPVGDEPGYHDVKMTLESAGDVTQPSWESFKRRAIGDSTT